VSTKIFAFSTLAQGDKSGINSPLLTAITKKSDWKALWKQHDRMDPANPAPEVDFRKTMVIAVFIGPRSSRGYGVTIESVEEKEKEITVTYRCTGSAGTNCAMSQPHHLVKVAASQKKVNFVSAAPA